MVSVAKTVNIGSDLDRLARRFISLSNLGHLGTIGRQQVATVKGRYKGRVRYRGTLSLNLRPVL